MCSGRSTRTGFWVTDLLSTNNLTSLEAVTSVRYERVHWGNDSLTQTHSPAVQSAARGGGGTAHERRKAQPEILICTSSRELCPGHRCCSQPRSPQADVYRTIEWLGLNGTLIVVPSSHNYEIQPCSSCLNSAQCLWLGLHTGWLWGKGAVGRP